MPFIYSSIYIRKDFNLKIENVFSLAILLRNEVNVCMISPQKKFSLHTMLFSLRIFFPIKVLLLLTQIAHHLLLLQLKILLPLKSKTNKPTPCFLAYHLLFPTQIHLLLPARICLLLLAKTFLSYRALLLNCAHSFLRPMARDFPLLGLFSSSCQAHCHIA